MVLLCAAGLGLSAVAAMRDRIQVDLPFKMKDQENALENAILQSLAAVRSGKRKIGIFSLQGNTADQ